MADISMKDFLLQYYMQLRFNQIPPEIRAQYDTYVKSDDFRGNMKEWKKKLMHDNGHGKFVQNDLPDPNGTEYHLTDAEWEKLFKAYQGALREMAAKRAEDDEEIKNNSDAKEFIDEYFGDAQTHLFSSAQIAPGYDVWLDSINAIFNANPDLKYVLREGGYTDDSLFDDLKKGIASRKYNSDPKFQKQLIGVIGFLAWKVNYDDGRFATLFNGINLQDIADNAFADTHISAQKLEYFKRNHQTLLNILYKKDKVFNVFRKYDNGKISGRIDAAREKLKYDDKNSDDYVPPKRDDELTPWQQLSRWTDDTYDNVLDKYLKFHGDRLYFSKNAENIVKAINGAKVKPTDGIDGVLKNADDIKKNLLYKSPTATKHFDWFVKTLGELSSTMKKAFAGALKNGRQMKAIVSEIIMKAVRDGKIEEAKTTMEVLSVIKYGAVTSKVMDALGKQDMTIFSDGKLSWNKNQAVQFVSKALDKSIKFAFMGVGYGITFVGNEIRLSGSKFNGRRGRITGAQTSWQQQTDAEKNAFITETNTQNAFDRNEIANQRAVQAATGIRDSSELTTYKNNSQAAQTDIDNAQKDIDKDNIKIARKNRQIAFYESQIQMEQNKAVFKRANTLDKQIKKLKDEIKNLEDNIARIDTELADAKYHTKPLSKDMRETANELARQRARFIIEKNALNADRITAEAERSDPKLINALTKINANINDAKTKKKAAENYKATYENDLLNHKGDLSALHTNKNALDKNIADYESAENAINELNQQIAKRDDTLRSWDDEHRDKYMELMAYWDMLETGRDSHMGKMYNWLPRGKKAAQKSFDAQKSAIISDYLSGYSYAA